MGFYFTNPIFLNILFFIPLVIIIHFFALRLKRRKAIKFANFNLIAKIKGVDFYSKNLVFLIFSILIIILLAFAGAGMHFQRSAEISKYSFVVAIDTSVSMEANDISPNRLQSAKDNAIKFVDLLPDGTKVGIISFSGSAFIESLVSTDKEAVKSSIRGIEISDIGGTDLSEAVVTASNLLMQESFKSVIVISDGRFSFENLDKVIDYAKKNSIVINTIGVGTKTGGNTTFGLSTLDEDTLSALAYNTNGNFYKVGSDGDFYSSFKQISETKKGEIDSDLSRYLLFIAVILLVLGYLIENTKYVTLP